MHFSFCFSAGVGVSTVAAMNLFLVHAGLCRPSPHRRAFFISFLRQHDHLDADGGDFASLCTLTSALLRLTGVHFLSRFSVGMIISTLTAGILPPCVRWPLPFFA